MLKSIWDELEDMNRKVEETFAFWPAWSYRRPYAYLSVLPPITQKPFVPKTEVFADKADLVVRLELPGINPEKDLSITLADGELVIKGERKQQTDLEGKTFFRFETVYGTFERHFGVPETLNEKAVYAEYKDGILEVIVKGAIEQVEARKLQAKSIPVTVKKPVPELASKV